MVRGMRCLGMLAGAFAAMSLMAVATPAVDGVAVLYNSAIPDSAKQNSMARKIGPLPPQLLTRFLPAG